MTKKAPSAFRTISEVAKELDVQQHVLRFWETKFSQIKPLKRGGGRRYYRPEDITLLKHIHDLLYAQGYTIKGVQNLLKGQTKNQIAANLNEQPSAPETVQQETKMVANGGSVTQTSDNSREREALKLMLSDLKEIRSMLGNGN